VRGVFKNLRFVFHGDRKISQGKLIQRHEDPGIAFDLHILGTRTSVIECEVLLLRKSDELYRDKERRGFPWVRQYLVIRTLVSLSLFVLVRVCRYLQYMWDIVLPCKVDERVRCGLVQAIKDYLALLKKLTGGCVGSASRQKVQLLCSCGIRSRQHCVCKFRVTGHLFIHRSSISTEIFNNIALQRSFKDSGLELMNFKSSILEGEADWDGPPREEDPALEST